MKRTALLIAVLALYSALLSCSGGSTGGKPVVPAHDTAFSRSAVLSDDSGYANKPYLADRLRRIDSALRLDQPVLRFETADASLQQAQELALNDPRFTANLHNEKGAALRNEIFNVYPARPGDVGKGAGTAGAYRVELYNYAYNLTTIAIVDVPGKRTVAVNTYPQTQPDIPASLKQIALKIAANSPEVMTALGYKPAESDALMANTKTALNQTRCERSMHLCVAPTFIKGDKALWVIVDLTDYKLVGLRWTHVGDSGHADEHLSERRLKYDKVMDCNCKVVTPLARDGWKMNYVLTSSDGLRISEVYFDGRLVIHNAKLVDWHVSYSGTDGFGYSDAVGCPEFSQAAVVAVSQPKVKTLMEGQQAVGFVLEQSFSSEQWPRPCNYNYIQRYEFYTDGRFRIACGSLGRGCGNDGTYRPVSRIVFAGEQNNFAEWNGQAWQPWTQEAWRLQGPQTAYTPQGYQYSISGGGGGYYMEPGNGQFGDGGRGDNAFVYATRYHVDKDEGEKDLVTIGPCCNTDYHQGPEKFIEPVPEDIRNTRIVVWYVAQLKNDDAPGREYCWAASELDKGVYKTRAYPCMSGPMFIPFNTKTVAR